MRNLVMVCLIVMAGMASMLLPRGAAKAIYTRYDCESINGVAAEVTGGTPVALEEHVHLLDDEVLTIRYTILQTSHPNDPYDGDVYIYANGHPVAESVYIKGQGQFTVHASSTDVYLIQAGMDTWDDTTWRVSLSCGVDDDDEGEQAGPPCENVADGRINNDPGFDCGAPIALYGGSLRVYAINPADGRGNEVIVMNDAQLAAQAGAVGNVLIAQAANPYTGQPIQVHYLSATDEIQVTTMYADGKFYALAWPVDRMDLWYHVAM